MRGLVVVAPLEPLLRLISRETVLYDTPIAAAMSFRFNLFLSIKSITYLCRKVN